MKKVISAGHICLDITPVFPAGKQYDRISSLLVPGKLIQMEAADVHILTDGEEQLVLGVGHGAGAGVPGGGHQSLHVGGGFLGDDLGHAGDELGEQRAAGHKVGLAVDFHDDADLFRCINGSISNALSRHTAGFLRLLRQTFLTQNINRFFHIAVAIGERLFAIHHTDAGTFTQRLNIFSSKSHNNSPLKI